MSSAVVCTSAAQGRPFIFDAEPVPQAAPPWFVPAPLEKARPPQRIRIADLYPGFASADPRLSGITPASRLDVRPTPAMVSSGIAALDALAGGLPRGCLTEICGPASSGRTTVLLAALAAATRRGEFCVVVDATDALDPYSVAAAGVDLDRLLWVRCGETPPPKLRAKAGVGPRTSEAKEKNFQTAFKFGRTESWQSEHLLEQVLRATDMLLESGGFGLIALDLTDLPPQTARRIPLTTWFRFRRAVEHTPTVLLSVEQHPIAGSCSSLLLKLGRTSKPLTESVTQENLQESKLQESNSLTIGNPAGDSDVPAAKRRKITAHGASHGSAASEQQAPEGRKKINLNEQTELYFPNPTRDFPYPTHAQLLTGIEITAELLCSRLERKPARTASAAFASKTAWAG
jgi:hypothetical protein